ncbi:MAG: class I SAM-dependent methyltransferase [Acidobacteria bacterium]|nr:class I SAM-dependent methyltransferase [Acidobacteriota bacterium]MBI3657367.1 class I SAM-dependent methyltransferase [Acidobacteriota bacterium]
MNYQDLIAIEVDRLQIQGKIDQQKTLAERNKLGQFATPSSLASEIAVYVKKLLGGKTRALRFSDPALGTGAFFSALLNVFSHECIASAIGIELDPIFAQSAHDLWKAFGLQVIQGDFTEFVRRLSGYQRPNLILTNPPYVRHHYLDRQQKARLQALATQATGLKVNGLAGLYVYYLLISHLWLEDDGVAAWLIPSEFMDVNYGDVVKKYLTERVTLIAAHRFDPFDVQFDDALVSSVIIVFRKAPPPHRWKARFTYGGTLGTPKLAQGVSLQKLRQSRKWTSYPMTSDPREPLHDESDRLLLSDLFKIQRGIATGANKFFILPRAEAIFRCLPEEYLRPILPSPRYLRETVIERDPDGYPKTGNQLALITCGLPDGQVREGYPSLWEYFNTAAARAIQRRYLIRNRKPWFKQEQRDRAPFLCTYMGRSINGKRSFRFIWNRSDAIAPNVYLMLYPIGPLAHALRERPELEALVYELINQITDCDIKGEGRVYGGGLHKIEPKELGRVSTIRFLDAIPELRKMYPRRQVLALKP